MSVPWQPQQLHQCFATIFAWQNAENNFPHPQEPLPVTTKTAEKQVVAHGDLPSTTNCRTNIPAKFRGIFENFSWNFKIFYPIIPRFPPRTSNDVPPNPGWEIVGRTISTEMLLTLL